MHKIQIHPKRIVKKVKELYQSKSYQLVRSYDVAEVVTWLLLLFIVLNFSHFFKITFKGSAIRIFLVGYYGQFLRAHTLYRHCL